VQRSTPTLHDVAREAGVSTATVSRCLNDPDRVIESTRLKVMAAVERLGYSPNFGARVMAARRTRTIGAIIPTMENAIFAQGLQAFQETLRDQGYTLLVASSSYQPQIEDEQIRSLVARGAEGLLLIGYERDPAVYRFLQTQEVPALITWAYRDTSNPPSVGFDNRAAMRALAEEVLRLGHRRIGVIAGTTRANDRAQERVAGIRDAANAAGLPPQDLHIIETDYGIASGARAMATLLAHDPTPSVVMCGNDVLAVGAMKQAKAMGLRVPEDLSITGFDDIELATIVSPELTTVHVPHREMGQRAAEALIEMVDGKRPNAIAPLPTTMRLRASLATPKSVQ